MMKGITKDLKNCPFCGSDRVSTRLTIGLLWVSGCDDCGNRTRECNSTLDSETAWNRRADEEDSTRSTAEVLAEMGIIGEEVPF